MKRIYQIVIALSFVGVPFLANAADVDDVTMRVMEHADKPDAVTKVIELPDNASDTAREKAEHGLTTANDARHQGEGKDSVNEREHEHEMDAEHEQERANAGKHEDATETEREPVKKVD